MTDRKISFRSYDGAERSHSHAYHQVILPLAGTMTLETGRGAGLVDDGQAAVVVAGESHAFEGRGAGNRFLILDVAAQRDSALWDRGGKAGFIGLGGGLRGLLRFAGELGPDPDPARADALASLLLHGLETEVDGRYRPEPLQLRRALGLMHAAYREPLTVESVARHAGASASTLTRLFRSHLGRAPAAYLAGLRLARAEELLTRSALPIAEIALRCGYGDQAALTRALRRERGVTPAALRRSAHGKPDRTGQRSGSLGQDPA